MCSNKCITFYNNLIFIPLSTYILINVFIKCIYICPNIKYSIRYINIPKTIGPNEKYKSIFEKSKKNIFEKCYFHLL